MDSLGCTFPLTTGLQCLVFAFMCLVCLFQHVVGNLFENIQDRPTKTGSKHKVMKNKHFVFLFVFFNAPGGGGGVILLFLSKCQSWIYENINQLTETLFQQDEETCHTSDHSLTGNNSDFTQQTTISKDPWLHHSPYFSPCDLYIWGSLKETVYCSKPWALPTVEKPKQFARGHQYYSSEWMGVLQNALRQVAITSNTCFDKKKINKKLNMCK